MSDSSILKKVRDFLVTISAVGAATFYVSPGVERVLSEMLGIRAWYWAAEYSLDADGIARADALNFYHSLIPHSFTLCEGGCAADGAVEALGEKTRPMTGDLVYATVSSRWNPVPGRADTDKFSRQKSLSEAFACYRVKDVRAQRGDPNASHPYNVYLKLVRTPCL